MAKFFDALYDPRQDSGTSAAESSDLRPEQAYDTDMRRVDPEERGAVEAINNNQERIGKFMRAAKSAGEYKKRSLIAEPTVNGRTPRNEMTIAGTSLPSMGDTIGRAGSTNYADKPGAQFGKAFV